MISFEQARKQVATDLKSDTILTTKRQSKVPRIVTPIVHLDQNRGTVESVEANIDGAEKCDNKTY